MKRFGRLLLLVIVVTIGVSLSARADDDVIITSQPVTVAQVGELYEYDVDATLQSGGGVITYELRQSPSGMVIDPMSGLIHWTPSMTGAFRVKIRAEADGNSPNHGGHADQEYTLYVLNGAPAALRGLVRTQTGVGVPNVRLRLFEISSEHFLFSTYTDSIGRYSFASVNPGTYVMRAQVSGNEFADQWYDRARRIQDATPIVIPESTTVEINVTLVPRDSLNDRFTLSGTVSDSSGAALRLAKVFIFRARQHDDHDPSGFNFEGLDDHDRDQRLEAVVVTDSLGRYQARLRSRTYILMAFKDGFNRQFWDHKTSPLNADRLRLIRDTTDLDFNLTPKEIVSGAIIGSVTIAGTSSPVLSHVVGFHRITATGRFTGFTRHALTDSLGRYSLNELRSGFYIVLAIPHGDFLPTYYDTSGGTLRLANAFPVSVANTTVNNINIGVLPDTVSGMNRVRGVARTGTQPLSGTIVYIVSETSGAVVGAAVSEQTGNYAIVGLAPGSYALHATNPGYNPTTSPSFTIAQQFLPATATMNVNLAQSPADVDATDDAVPQQFGLHQNYPNPFNPSTTIRYQLPANGQAALKVFDVLGREVATLINETQQSGSHEVIWDARGVSSGVYFYKLKAGNFSETKKMVLTR